MLEQLLLQLRRSGLVEARRGRYGGYRLGRPAREIPVAAVLVAVAGGGGVGIGVPAAAPIGLLERDPDALAAPEPQAVAEERVLAALERRLQRALERELRDLSLEELLYDLRSWQESLSNEGGLLLG